MLNQPSARILIIEDVDSKFSDIVAVLSEALKRQWSFTRATNLNDAEDRVMEGGWSLLVLDLSMDIAPSGSLDLQSGHATLGGLDILERIALLKLSLPTVLVTGFDSFQDPDRFENAIMNMADVDDLGSRWLNGFYLGCVRYGIDGWADRLKAALMAWEAA